MGLFGYRLMEVTARQIMECLVSMGMVEKGSRNNEGKEVSERMVKKIVSDAYEICELAS